MSFQKAGHEKADLKKIALFLWAVFGASLGFWIFRLWGHFPASMDTLEYVFPEKWFNVESFRNGRIPLWNPYLACGTPHVANLQSAAFYPLFWIWNLTGLTDWFFLVSLLHALLAAAGFYFWLKAQEVAPAAASLCALSFGGSALMVNFWGFPTHLASIAWVPWIFWGTVQLTREPGFVRWVLAALFWTMQILAGYPFFTFYSALFLGVWMWAKNTRNLKLHLIHGSAFAAALLLTACQWMPFLDFAGYLHRQGWGENLFSLRWLNYQTLFWPSILGTPGTASYRGDYPNFIYNNFYPCLIPLVFFFWSFFSAKARDYFWKGSALFWLLWLAGSHLFIWRLLPAYWLERVEPSKASFLFLFCFFTSVGISLQEKVNFTPRKSAIWKYAWILGAFWLLDLLAVPGRIVQIVPDPYRNPEVRQSADLARRVMGNGRLVSLRDANRYYSSDVKDLEGSFRETAQALIPNTNVIWGLRSVRGYLTIYTDGFQNINRYIQGGSYEGRILDAAGASLFVFSRTLPSFKYQSFDRLGPNLFIKNAGAMGNAWEVSLVKNFNDRREVFESLLDPRAFLEDEVFTENNGIRGAVTLPAAQRPLAGYSGVSLFDRWTVFARELFQDETKIQPSRPSPCEAAFEIASSHRGFLVFDESFSPGWHAWVDGEPKPIFRANGLWMAVPLPETGAHRVNFRYEPVSFRLGLFVTLLTLAVLGVAILLKRREFWLFSPRLK